MKKKEKTLYTKNKVGKKTVYIYKDIKFDSPLEVYCYHRCLEEGFQMNYHPNSIQLQPSLKLDFEYYESKGKGLNLITSKIRDISYTIDFMGWYKNTQFQIETKGHRTDVFNLRFKLFLYKLNNYSYEGKLFLPRNQKDIEQMIKIIKNE